MPVVVVNTYYALGILLLVLGLPLLIATFMIRRWKHNMDVSGDAHYVETLAMLSEGSVRRHFNPYTDIDWDAPDFSVTGDDPRWVVSATEPLGRHPWYLAQPLDKQIAIGMWRAANLVKVAEHFESVLVRGLMQYAFFAPNGSPEYRYCLHESVEECNHSMMFQEMVNRIGLDVPGMPRWLRWLASLAPLAASPLPNTFFFGVLAGEVPFDHMQTKVLREGTSVHPIVHNIIAIHVAEEARHISFAHEYLRKRVPNLLWFSRFWLSLFVPLVMAVLGRAMVVPSRRFFTEFDIPRPVRKDLQFSAPYSRQPLRDMFADVRMLCHEVGLMNPVALLLWRVCRIGGRPARYRSEPQRTHRSDRATAVEVA